MTWTNTKRIIKAGFMSFWRSGVVSISAILMMTIALLMIGTTILTSAYLQSTLGDIEKKVDVNVYLDVSATENDVLALKQSLENLPEVKEVTYTSKEDNKAAFIELHKDDELLVRVFDELDDNPLRPILKISAKDPSQYGAIASFLEHDTTLSSGGASIINKVTYKKDIIDRLIKILAGARKVGFSVAVALVLISIFITLNTLRLVIYISREEISVMQLVGANSKYIRGPFVIEGVIYGVVSSLLTLALFYPLTSWVRNVTGNFYGGIDLFKYYVDNFGQIFIIIMGSGITLGVISSLLAIRRYLKQ
ncbi:MAG: hypothetical protein COZ49_04430 [Candidatus Yonathbacteria bacterium CG_4_10_14_3_um_filter_47_65]|uniref:Cell division protein FtsX n=2 Tax=Parcubacteria group TaxID=1794811 RepID=A0A2M8D7B2_9BACT|nr:MAG: hypothetical protein COX54_01065 [Candidatus Yonathbacteria bacterium CG23_combo_of_CG06-09_8_20_14_all_46_18]PIQ32436.1 MAG: hypothetical protein COW61_01675 [Candidatus Yonathbacteria bacterium CG17_big_fil_post_rev_8_21_14_2_50_46_19]PIX55997.1 MAG: hypothetical protein COZ49_04430 [Candidatus Yonathbacteria bacterium CG_4_10_14_3_um_filter_47_65]PIY57344.1 MAG: hypothetical protein COY99_03750 [Candidatus Yonathbacteria bacterium CG_4_10_14_0_8_um_filter_47_645]PJB83024.1 MAG: hypot